MAERTVLRKDQLEISLVNEKKLIKEGYIKDDNPLDLSEPFRELCSACRKGDLVVCQTKITEGVNVNARDPYDYTPLILVSLQNVVVTGFAGTCNNRTIPCTGESLRTL
jgi:ankyrin repeat/BTB/POZ domain-containing protein 1